MAEGRARHRGDRITDDGIEDRMLALDVALSTAERTSASIDELADLAFGPLRPES